ncbi:hypothetical protein A2121_01355 [Candidatus Nomurabacteria bacterium GWB1_40_6]|uniref:Uncharacterized protein n=1 Tax=Candidatus Nomurabacteria bacterium GWB1_40_6 TaxID=1801727 RepID=A0A1F6TM40_9BACT|nr:MAG: hypothetical protein A2121_01355 [Candidatus Nomurabacteria bacterium GWB1_40_6]
MKNIYKYLGLGLLALALVVGVGAGSANAALTFATNAVTEDGALTVTAAGALGFVTGANAINLGTDAVAKTITIGNTTGATVIILNAGTDGIEFEGDLVTKGAVPVYTESGAGVPTGTATNTDTAGLITSSTTSHTTVVATFSNAYATAPVCVVSPANTAAGALAGGAASYFASTSTTALTITTAASTSADAWSYFCIEAE